MDNQTALALTITAFLTGLGLFLWMVFEDKIEEHITTSEADNQ